MINVSHLTKRFGPFLAVDDISFQVQRKEIVGFLGPNGAGKTTTMRILTGYLAATEGRVLIDGLDVFTQSLEVRRRIGYLPENVPLYPELRVDEYLTFRARLKGVTRRKLRERLADVKALCGLEDMGRRIIGQLSRGYWQRIGLADSLIHDPELLILDEPTIGLDPNQIRAIRELMMGLAKRYTIVLSTHFLVEAEMVCQRVMILNRGRIVADDSPARLAGLLKGNACLVAEVCGPVREVTQALSGLPHVLRVSVEPGAEPESLEAVWRRYIVECEKTMDVRSTVYELAVRRQWRLRELRVEEKHLEDVFVEMTSVPPA